jgi:TonB family protein
MSMSEVASRAEPLEDLSAPEAPDPAERLTGPERLTSSDRRGLTLALIAAAALHLIIPFALFIYYALWPAVAPVTQEIPVEVVVEQPPPQAKPPEDKPRPPPQPDDERPAYDAPAAPTHDKVNRESPDKMTQAPASDTALSPNPGAPRKTEAQASTVPAENERLNNAPPPPDLKPIPDGEQPADVNPAPEDNSAEGATQAPEPSPKASVGTSLPTIETLPQYKFARAVKDSPITGGNADSRYFTIVYGMIRSHFRDPPGANANASAPKQGAIVFGVDEGGNLLGRKVVTSSGSPNLDMAVMAAIAEAAPYPAPPNWQPRTMRLTYGGR